MGAAEIAAIITGLGAMATALVTAFISARRSDMEALQVILDEVQEENGRLRQELQAEAVRNADLRARMTDVEAELHGARKQITDMECELKRAREEIAALTRENVELRTLLQRYRSEGVTSG